MQDRDYTQMEVAEKLSKAVQKKTMARSFVQQSSSFGGRRGGMPVQYVLQATNIEKLQEVLPKFMAKVYENPVFQMADVDLKFSKPEARININRDKAKHHGCQHPQHRPDTAIRSERTAYGLLLYEWKAIRDIGRNQPSATQQACRPERYLHP